MRVLWFTNSPSNYLRGTNAYNGGGWISSLESELKKRDDVELGIAFQLNGHPKKMEKDGVCYYPIHNPYKGSLMGKIRKMLKSEKDQNDYFMYRYLKVIDDFHPDIINIFGTEQDFGLMAQYTHVPIVIHLQGLLEPCQTAFFPPGFDKNDYVWGDLSPLNVMKRHNTLKALKSGAEREKNIFKCNRHFMGRTAWDKKLTSIFSPESTYDHCDEILREVFYHPYERQLPNNLVITSTMSSPLYKGFDVILKCAELMTNEMNLEFEWRVYGNIDPRNTERKVGIRGRDVNIRLMGVASSEELTRSLLESTLYVHPSYIDNSPNSVCEAQMLGCTVVGQFVGGMPSLVTEGTGILVPANDPYQMACAIRDLNNDTAQNVNMGRIAAVVAHKRHDKQQIVNDLLAIYMKYIQE